MEILAFEYRRAKSIRTTWITSLFVILAAAAFAYLGTFADDFDEGLDRIPTTDLVAGALLGNPIVIVLIASLGAMAFGHEYRYGTIRLTLTAFPGRVGVFFGKLFTTVALTLFVVALAAVAGYALLVLLGETASGGPSWATVAWQVAVFTLTYALLAFSLTLITRNHPLGIIGPLILFLLEQAVIGLLGARLEWLPSVLPLASMQSWFSGVDVALSAGVWAAWMVGLLLVGLVLLRRRDA
ncbi:MAG: ABC transporter permease [Actinobacteria bacterium]|jgi:ABC-2 type transport system permease protein|nr:ABC transporter permease [Micrococcales bacterium]MCB9429031.1 ABC transporter permease [Actinomycetota bacterium]MCO5298625.1 ABC transporter permease [Candidatus Nanopelagicales bacterium]HPE12752.1 ABC transporter permease [Actinomycetota bacterium]HPJ19497.1 ABC transporter permease [Actinomycetota bacterium]